jgi:autotransporter-associated beta strand protein
MSTPVAAALRYSLILLVSAVAYAGSAHWNPTSGDWNTADNWTPMTVPNGPADTATFGRSHMSDASISTNTEISEIIFTPAARNSYTITASVGLTLTLSGRGVTNNSGIAQNLITNGGPFGQLIFTNNATAGNSTIFTNNHGVNNSEGGSTFFFNTSSAGNGMFMNENGTVGTEFFGFTYFFDSSSAAHATFINKGTTFSDYGDGGETTFADASTAGDATITNNGAAASNAYGGQTIFIFNSTAGNATIVNNGGAVSGAYGGSTQFFAYFGNPTAGSATIISDGGTVSGAYGGLTGFSSFNGTPTAGDAILVANGGLNGGEGGMISFEDNSTGSTSRIAVFGNGSLDISGHDSPGVTIGSIEGNGDAFLGVNNLTVGSNNLCTTFSGVIQDGGSSGSFTEIGTKMLILRAANLCSAASNTNRGVLQVDGSVLSDTFAIQGRGRGESLTKIGKGTLIFSGANTYTGDTNVNGGVLQIDGSISSNTFVNRGGTLAGSGSVAGSITNLGGTISPGDASGVPGVLRVEGNYTNCAGQIGGPTLAIQIGGENVGQVSVLNVEGNANLRGFLDPVLVNGFVPEIGQSFTFLNYASFTGRFCIRKPVFDQGRKRWSVAYSPTSATLIVKNHYP